MSLTAQNPTKDKNNFVPIFRRLNIFKSICFNVINSRHGKHEDILNEWFCGFFWSE